ncbi:TPA: hypothetical protein DDW69_02000 [candidate division CPR2 bacterium]|uniref:Uncharacterized protein n=1 Tax=candidate division CPR2 bacterium GW2011_GWC1_41_48 TaxID=1618344 RepID=A0A0G0YJT5_UNCC2|nr:MAG: hypothetical protein UT47_C0001G0201 [candidate division CPR2 bacterium GW2011_GWC2_39_35]KKR27021.1 MAG: hypothetical protein UT59_C0073G0006 [candidate division CPR2 bacterium GW2011_GWD1_39_7]KKR28146.1 MAG: hypothetical protein UT60_C0027G0036 [candidate division CPR2 bacterium GW2011_GWD2_39_7]KKS09796.1 MAG: hypothetical protein UU65_C0001G0201 [candidate division CPR2 bacterium GW2011_GWC1_41_48]OGB56531.1 MAG: hypothetical protein A2Y27_00510 [candidate division CPR2 bacterium G
MENTNSDLMCKFIEEYNQLYNTPDHKVNEIICEQYRNEHPNEFKNSEWSIDKHRKRLMDWMSRQKPETLALFDK